MTYPTNPTFKSFPVITDKNENSIFIYACIKASTEELIKLTTVKIPITKIDTSQRDELYPGRKYPHIRAKNNIVIPRISLSVSTFQIIFFASFLFSVISRIVIV